MSRKARKFKGFFRPKLGDLQKKKKVFAKIQSDFSAEIQNSNVFLFSKKKRSSPKFRVIFLPISQVQTFEGGLFLYGGGGYFPFFTGNRPQKHKKHAILHTSQANGGARAPLPPLLATLLVLLYHVRIFRNLRFTWINFSNHTSISIPCCIVCYLLAIVMSHCIKGLSSCTQVASANRVRKENR